jgi:mannose-6-phosphate isomerase-like protein (cupin superfamily)
MIRQPNNHIVRDYPNLWQGQGTIASQRIVEGLTGSAIKAIVVNRIPPGASIGQHCHHNEEDCYFCISGQGVVEDNGVEHPFVPGTLQITRDGQTQAIRNTGTEDLVVFAFLIAAPSADVRELVR